MISNRFLNDWWDFVACEALQALLDLVWSQYRSLLSPNVQSTNHHRISSIKPKKNQTIKHHRNQKWNTILICKKSLIPNEIAYPWMGESSSTLPSYETFVLTAKATVIDYNKKNSQKTSNQYKTKIKKKNLKLNLCFIKFFKRQSFRSSSCFAIIIDVLCVVKIIVDWILKEKNQQKKTQLNNSATIKQIPHTNFILRQIGD